jgi:hypothetical protein
MARAKKGLAYLTGYDLRPRGRTVRMLDLTPRIDIDGREFDPNTIALFYGAQATLRQMSRLHAYAIRTQQDLYQISLGIDVENIIIEFLTLDDLKNTKMMNMERISKELQLLIQSYWRGYLKEEGLSDEWIDANVEWRSHRYVSERPDLISKLAKEPEFRHLNLIIAQIVENNEVLKIGIVLKKEAIEDVSCKTHPNIPVRIDGKVVTEPAGVAEAVA